VWHDVWPWLLGTFVVGVGAVALYLALRRPRVLPDTDLHERALERWLAGDLAGARDLMHEAVRQEPHRSAPYLHLGILLRLTGEASRAAALHRSLSVRPELPPGRRVVVGLELATDLLELKRWSEAEEVLSQLGPLAATDERWYRLRFAAAVGRQDNDAALAALRGGEKKLEEAAAARLRSLRAAWLTDRALQAYRRGANERARDILGKVRALTPAAGRALLVRSLLAAADRDPEQAVKTVAEGLATYPEEMTPALGLLEGVLLDTGRFTRVIPILEDACRASAAPPPLWMALARLYEKLDRREDALRLLTSKRGDPRLTPDAAAPYLRLLTADDPDAACSRVWNLLSAPGAGRGFRCRTCGRREPEIRWFCPDCLSPDSFVPAAYLAPPSTAPAPPPPPPMPPRY